MDQTNKSRQELVSEIRNLRAAVKELKQKLEQAAAADQFSVACPPGCQTLWDHSLDAVLIADAGTEKIIDCNSRAEQFLQLQRDEIIGSHYSCFHPREHLETVRHIFEDCAKKNIHGQFEVPLARKDGSTLWVTVNCVSFDVKGKKFLQGTFRDITRRKQMEEALRENEERYRQFLSHFPGIVFRGTMNFKPQFFHGAVKDITGYSEKDFVEGGLSWKEVIAAEDWPRVKEAGEKLKAKPDLKFEREYRIIHKDTSIRWVHEFVQNVCDDSGKPVAVEGVILDITAHRVLEAHLEESERRYRSLTENSRDYIYILDNRGIVQFVNAAGAEVLHKKPEEIVGRSIEQFFGGEQAVRMKKNVGNVFKSGQALLSEEEIAYGAQSQFMQTWLIPLKDQQHKVASVLGVSRDMTEHHQLEQGIQVSEERYRLIAEKAQDYIYIYDSAGRFQYVNHALAAEFRKPAEGLIGKTFEEILPASSARLRRENLHTVMKAGKPVHLESIVEFPSRSVYLDSWLIPQKDRAGRIISILGISRDINDRKKYELALQESELKLREQKLELEKKNIALQEMFKQIEIEREKIKQQVVSNVDTLLLPTLKRAKVRRELSPQLTQVMEHHLRELISAFGTRMSGLSVRLSPREMEICSMVKAGLSSKDISRELRISCPTVERHRNNIRKKLGLVKKSINLISYLKEQ